MKYRKKLTKRNSNRKFKKSAQRTHKKNLCTGVSSKHLLKTKNRCRRLPLA